jgi:hypothetical protein
MTAAVYRKSPTIGSDRLGKTLHTIRWYFSWVYFHAGYGDTTSLQIQNQAVGGL